MENLKDFLRSVVIVASIAVAAISLYLFYLEDINQRLFEYYELSDLITFLLVILFVALVGFLIFFYVRLLMKKKYGMSLSFTFLAALAFLSIFLYSSMILSAIFIANIVGLALVIYYTKEKEPKTVKVPQNNINQEATQNQNEPKSDKNQNNPKNDQNAKK